MVEKKSPHAHAFLHGSVKTGFVVGFVGEVRKGEDARVFGDRYHGPIARIDHDAQWLHIITDDYEGAAMLNIETLPKVRKALALIARHLRALNQRSLVAPSTEEQP